MGSGNIANRTVLRRSAAILTAMLLVLSGLGNVVGPSPAVAQEAQIPYGNVIVVLQDGVDPALFATASGVSPAFVYDTLITGFAANLTPEAARRLAQVPQVEGIFPDLPVDPTAQIIPTGVERVNAPRNPFQPFTNGSGGSVSGTVAVVDSGVASLGDLNVVGGYNCTSGDTGDYGDGFGHGTHVAGTLAAINNNDGVVGVAPGVGIFSARMLNSSGSGSQSNLICALEAVAQQSGIRVANLSLTTTDSSPGTCGVDASALHQSICNLVNSGTSVVVAAGNFGQLVTSASMAGYPEVIAVSAFNDFDGKPGALSSSPCASGGGDDTFWASSNYGSLVDIMAPGVCIRSYNQTGAQVYRSGTSMSTPHVVGALALYYAANPGASVSGAQSWLLGTAARSQSAAGVSGAPSGEPVLSLGADLPTPTPTPSASATANSHRNSDSHAVKHCDHNEHCHSVGYRNPIVHSDRNVVSNSYDNPIEHRDRNRDCDVHCDRVEHTHCVEHSHRVEHTHGHCDRNEYGDRFEYSHRVEHTYGYCDGDEYGDRFGHIDQNLDANPNPAVRTWTGGCRPRDHSAQHAIRPINKLASTGGAADWLGSPRDRLCGCFRWICVHSRFDGAWRWLGGIELGVCDWNGNPNANADCNQYSFADTNSDHHAVEHVDAIRDSDAVDHLDPVTNHLTVSDRHGYRNGPHEHPNCNRHAQPHGHDIEWLGARKHGARDDQGQYALRGRHQFRCRYRAFDQCDGYRRQRTGQREWLPVVPGQHGQLWNRLGRE